MKCFVEEHEVPAGLLARQPMNFNQPWPLPARPARYRILMEGSDFLDTAKPEFERAKQEEVADAPFHGPGESPELDRWQELGYPSIDDLLAHHPKVLEGLVGWMGAEILDRILPGPADSFRYVLNSLDRVSVANGLVCLEGQAYERVATGATPEMADLAGGAS